MVKRLFKNKFGFFFLRNLLEPLQASTSLHKLPQAVKYPQSSQVQHLKPPFQKPQLQKPAEKASLATDPLAASSSSHIPSFPSPPYDR
jgi:hypothetical protein